MDTGYDLKHRDYASLSSTLLKSDDLKCLDLRQHQLVRTLHTQKISKRYIRFCHFHIAVTLDIEYLVLRCHYYPPLTEESHACMLLPKLLPEPLLRIAHALPESGIPRCCALSAY